MKKVYDSLHGFIYLDHIEEMLLHSRPIMRLQSVLQLGAAYLVYPGATHSRFEHSLGTMRLATKIYERVIQSKQSDWLPKIDSFEYNYYKRIVRLAALCHDLGHLPFSHSAENRILGKSGHEALTLQIIRSKELKPVWQALREDLAKESSTKDFPIEEDVIKCAVGEEKLSEVDPSYVFTHLDKVVSQIITADLFGADRIDYLLRDSKATGLAYGNIDYVQLIETLSIMIDPNTNDPFLGIDEEGIESCEALLLARYFMHRRLCQYPSVKAYSFHLARFMESYFAEHNVMGSLNSYIKCNDHIISAEIYKNSYNKSHPRHFDALRVVKQAPRFKAYRLPKELEEKDMHDIKYSLSIPDERIGWDFITREKDEFTLSFLPFKEAEELSYRWVFVAPEFKNPLLGKLGWNEKQIVED